VGLGGGHVGGGERGGKSGRERWGETARALEDSKELERERRRRRRRGRGETEVDGS